MHNPIRKMNILYGIFYYLIAQALVWIQLYGHMNIDIIKNNRWIIYLISIPITHFFILATDYTVLSMNGAIWGSRFVQFTTGIAIFSLFTWYVNGEGIDLKTGITLLLIIVITCIQIFWKQYNSNMKTEIKQTKVLIASLQKKYESSPNQGIGSLISSLELVLLNLMKMDSLKNI